MNSICYERPATELIRTYLRFERSTEQITNYVNNPAVWDSRHALTAIIETLQILDRPDLKSKLTQECLRLLETLQKMKHTPGVDPHKLQLTINELDDGLTYLNTLPGKFAAELRENYFIEHIRQLMQGTLCALDSPAYHYWLSLPPETRIQHLTAWQQHFVDSHKIVKLMLRLIRQSQSPKTLVTTAGFHQQSLDPHQQNPWQLIQVRLPQQLNCYPEISVSGKHRLCIRFLQPNFNEKPKQYTDEVSFQLTCCVI